MYSKTRLTAYLRSRTFGYCFTLVLIFGSSAASFLAFCDQSEESLAFHKLATQVFPELDIVIFDSLEKINSEGSELVLSQAAALAYQKWHLRVQEIQNSPVPDSARLLVHHLSPEGFKFTMKRHIFQEPAITTYSREELVLYYFLQVIGTAIKENDTLQPLQTDLSTLFECHGRNCEIQAGISDTSDESMSLKNQIKLQQFTECLETKTSITSQKKEEFCDSFLTWTI